MFDPEAVQHTFLHSASFERDYVGIWVTVVVGVGAYVLATLEVESFRSKRGLRQSPSDRAAKAGFAVRSRQKS